MKFDILKRPKIPTLEFDSSLAYYHKGTVDAWLDQAYEVLDKAMVVQAVADNLDTCWWSAKHEPEDTHQALLIQIEPIEKKECEHFGVNDIKASTGERGYHCFHCGKNLKPNWTVIE